MELSQPSGTDQDAPKVGDSYCAGEHRSVNSGVSVTINAFSIRCVGKERTEDESGVVSRTRSQLRVVRIIRRVPKLAGGVT